MTDLLPGDKVRIRVQPTAGIWAGLTGTITYASDGHGSDRTYDVHFEHGSIPDATFVASECEEVERSGGGAHSPEPVIHGR